VKRVDFYYDFSCPYAYLAHTQIEALCERAGAALSWRPMLLGGVFQALGSPQIPASTMSVNKARLNDLDMRRWADHFGVPLVMPPTHPNRTVLALRAALAAEEELPRASRALFRAYWAFGKNLAEPTIVREALDDAGLDGAALVRRADDPILKHALRARTDEAIALDIFGAPSFMVTAPGIPKQLFWGQDRLDFVEKALGGWSAPLLPSGGFSS
jgi:2-hydroxychromene-2-carboxylate isomerase